jgi:aryl-alcohol dehydrogenase-like predicted oxidoreductase
LKLGLGTVQFGMQYGIANRQGQVSVPEVAAILQRARAAGLELLDTAIVYGDSEQRLGEIGVAGWNVVSKLPAVPDDVADAMAWVGDSVRQSVARLCVPRLYGLLLHRPGQLLERRGRELFQALERLKVDGVVEKIGVSIYDPAELDALCAAFRFDLVQAPLNLLDQRLVASGWLSRLAGQGTEVHVRSVFLQGLLLMPGAIRPPAFARWAALWADFDRWLEQSGLTPLQACLRHALSFPEVSHVIVGTDTRDQLDDILRAADGPPPSLLRMPRTEDPILLNPARWGSQ